MRTAALDHPRREAWRWLLLAPAVFLITIGAVAKAQGLSIPAPATWFLSTAAWGVITSQLVSTIRANLLPNVKGIAAIGLVFAVSIVGALVASTGVLATAGIHLDASFTEALIFGIIAGGIALGWWDGVTAIAAKSGEANANAQLRALHAAGTMAVAVPSIEMATLVPAAKVNPQSAASIISPGTLTDFLLDQIRRQFGQNLPPLAFAILETLAREFTGRALTPEVKAQIQDRLLDLISAAGAPGKDL